MKTLFIQATKNQGGACIAANSLAKAIKADQFVMYGKHATYSYPVVYSFLRTLIEKSITKILLRKDYASLQIVPSMISKKQFLNQYDIIHFHWPHLGFISLNDIKRIAKSKTVFWTAHDLWPILGSYHYPSTEDSFETYLLSKKVKLFKESNVHFICPSRWVKKQFDKHNLLSTVIYNGIDTNIFSYKQKKREGILIGAQSINDKRKGFDLFLKAYDSLIKKPRVKTFGKGKIQSFESIGSLIPSQLAIQYQKAQVVVVPSRMETFGLVAAESLCCGTPVVCFANTAVAELVEHKVNGYVAKYENIPDLAKGISWALKTKHNNKKIATTAQKLFNSTSIAKQHKKLYKQVHK